MPDRLAISLGSHRRLLEGSDDLLVGRDAEAQLRVEDDRVSRRHARILLGPDGWVFEDTSRNGSFVGTQRISSLTLASGVRIRLGNPLDGPVLEVVVADAPSIPSEPVSLGQRTGLHRLQETVRIGRGPGNDITLDDDLSVSRQHARVRRIDDGHYEVTDLGSFNGTYLNGERITTGVLESGGILALGQHLFTLSSHGLEEYVDIGRVRLQVSGLTVTVSGKQRLLEAVSFALDESSFMAVVGPTGAGKSTLMNALMGFRRAQHGRVLYGGRDLFQNFEELRRRIGFVPQDDVLHIQLSARRALGYAAELRFPADTSRAERRRRIEEVLGELGLQDRGDLAIHKLSGGQRKRTSVALELLTRPSLLLLDEPTSGLDPGYERVLMGLFRDLARGGRTVIVVTHSLQSLDLCDRVLFLAPGGRTAFFGSPKDALGFFGHSDYPEIFRELEQRQDIDWKGRFERSRFYDTNVRRRLGSGPAAASGAVREARVDWPRQFSVLVRRYVAVLRADTRNFWLLLLQGPLLGLLMLAAMPKGGLERGATPNGDAHTVLMTLMLSGTFLGASNAIREIVKERAIFRRERAIGLAPSAYVASKGVVLAALTVAQAFVLVALALTRQNAAPKGIVFSSPVLELGIAIALTGLTAMAIGLVVSAFVRNADIALTILPLVLLTELILSGALFVLGDKPVLSEASYLAGSRWGFSMTAATVDLRGIEFQRCVDGAKHRLECAGSSDHSASAWWGDATVLSALTAAGLVGAWASVRRIDPAAS